MIHRSVLGAVSFLMLVSGSVAAEPTPKPRGLWFWSKPASPHGAVNVLGHEAREAEALATFARWNIRRLYGSYVALPVEAPGRVAAWNRRLHAAGIRSETLFSEGNALTPEGRAAFLRQIDERVLAFNAGRLDPAERFDGIALDIEPHALPRWKSASGEGRRQMLEEYVNLCAALRAHLDARGGRELALSAALAYWLDRLPPAGRAAWRSAEDRDDWFARLARSVASISLMAYERSAAPAILDATAWERANFRGRVITALRARLGVEWRSLADLQRVLPEVETVAPHGIDLENYELLRLAESTAKKSAAAPPAPLPLVKYIEPRFPPMAQAEGILTGAALVVFCQDDEGRVEDALAVAGTHPDFAQEAVAAVRRWQLAPRAAGASPAADVHAIRFNFRVGGVVYLASTPLLTGRPGAPGLPADDAPLRVVTFDDLDARPQLLRSPRPALPVDRKGGLEGGVVRVRFFVDEEGRVRVPAVVATPHPVLGAAVVRALAQWRYEPPRRSGRPVVAMEQVDFSFAPAAERR